VFDLHLFSKVEWALSLIAFATRRRDDLVGGPGRHRRVSLLRGRGRFYVPCQRAGRAAMRLGCRARCHGAPLPRIRALARQSSRFMIAP
jgi:hypothetical protein